MAGEWEDIGSVGDHWETLKKKPEPPPAPRKEESPAMAPLDEASAAIAEPLLAAGTAMVAKPISDVAGLARLGMEGLRRAGVPGIEERDPQTVKEDVQKALTYEPRTAAGKAITEAISTPGKLWSMAAKSIASNIAPEKTSGPVRAAMGKSVEELVNDLPMVIGGKAPAAAGAVSRGMEAGAERLMQSALKPPFDAQRLGQAQTAIKTMLDEGINVSKGGVEKMHFKIDNLSQKIGDVIDNSPATVDKMGVAAKLLPVWQRFLKQADPFNDLAAIQTAYKNFLNHPLLRNGTDIPIKTAQEIKQGTHRALEGKYGELKSAEVEAQKSIASYLRESIANLVPEVKPLNAQESKLLTALPLVERRVLLSANKNPIGLGVLTTDTPRFVAWMADRSDLFKSLVARMLHSSADKVTGKSGPLVGAEISIPANAAAERVKQRQERARLFKERANAAQER